MHLWTEVAPCHEGYNTPLSISPYGATSWPGRAIAWPPEAPGGGLRLAHICGAFSVRKNSGVAKFCKDVLTEGQISIDSDGQQIRDFIYVGDLCRAILRALEGNASGEVFQIATGVETSIVQWANSLVLRVVGRDVEMAYA